MPDFRLFQFLIKGQRETLLRFHTLGQGLKDFRFVWPAVSKFFYQIETEQFGGEGRSRRWATLSPAYGKWKAAHFPGKPILQREGPLVASLTRRTSGSIYEEAPLRLVLGSSIRYATAHQRGRGKMPARPPIDMTPSDFKGFGQVLQKGFISIAEKSGFRPTGLAA